MDLMEDIVIKAGKFRFAAEYDILYCRKMGGDGVAVGKNVYLCGR